MTDGRSLVRPEILHGEESSNRALASEADRKDQGARDLDRRFCCTCSWWKRRTGFIGTCWLPLWPDTTVEQYDRCDSHQLKVSTNVELPRLPRT
jgi:hypothetical protein